MTVSMSPIGFNISKNNTPILGLIVICGPTAMGKSSLAIALAKRLNSVILSADSRQVYREFNIGTAKPTLAEQKEVPHYLIDICAPTETLTLAEYQEQAQALIGKNWEAEASSQQSGGSNRGIGYQISGMDLLQPPHSLSSVAHSLCPTPYPLLVGGTGLYIRAITKGLKIPRVPPQPMLRSQLQTLGQTHCYALLQQVDPQSASKIHAHDQVRTLRSLEVFYTTGRPMSEQVGEHPPTYPILQIGLDCEDTTQRAQRIAQRTQHMVANGFVEEVDHLCKTYGQDLPLLNTLGYAEFKHYLLGKCSRAEAIEQTILHTRQFAKRQRTWFRAYPEIEWFDPESPNFLEKVWQRVNRFIQNQ